MDMRKQHQFINTLLIISFLICGSTFAYAQNDPLSEVKATISSKYPSISFVTAEQLSKWLAPNSKKEIMLFDVRSREEYEISHIKGAIYIEDFDHSLVLLFGKMKDTLIITYDSVGLRSAKFTDKLTARDFNNVYNLEGSIFEWANNGYPLYKGSQRVYKVHPNDLWWGRYLKDELSAW